MQGEESKVGIGRVIDERDGKEAVNGRDKGWGGTKGVFRGDEFVF